MKIAEFICEKCGLPIRGHKDMKIENKRYHMTCGLNLAKEKNILNRD